MKRRPPLNAAQKAMIAKLRGSGRGIGSIATELGVSYGTVAYFCLSAGVESPTSQGRVLLRTVGGVYRRADRDVRRFTPAEDETLLALAATGKRYCEIAEAIGRAPPAVKFRLLILARHDARREAAQL